VIRSAYLGGVALWSPLLPGWDQARDILAGRASPAQIKAARPSAQLLPPNERRRAPDSVAIALHVALSACQHAGREPASLRSVFTSMHGDLAITDYMCSTLAADPLLVSPTRFHNSVHNAAAGYWSIGTGSTRPYTALSAGHHSFAAGLLESLLQLASSEEDVLFVSYDIESRGPLAAVAPSQGLLAAALVMASRPGDRCVARVDWELTHDATLAATAPRPENAALVAGNSNERCLPLYEALASHADADLSLPVSRRAGLRLRVSPTCA
jgi:hypothetical protein